MAVRPSSPQKQKVLKSWGSSCARMDEAEGGFNDTGNETLIEGHNLIRPDLDRRQDKPCTEKGTA